MTFVVALSLVVGACLLWPSGRTPAVDSAARANGADPIGCPANDRSESVGEVEHAEPGTAVTVDAAADSLVLCALALRSGLGPVEALEAVAEHVNSPVAQHLRVVASAHRWGQDAATSWSHVGEEWRPAALAWQAAEQSGAAPAGVVLAAAERMRREESSRVEAAVQRAGVLLVLPLGACFLPGFVGTTVVPIVLHLARSSLGVGG